MGALSVKVSRLSLGSLGSLWAVRGQRTCTVPPVYSNRHPHHRLDMVIGLDGLPTEVLLGFPGDLLEACAARPPLLPSM